MGSGQTKTRSAVRHERAEEYLLLSLVAFGVTVIVTRVFLQVTGFPQIGNSVLHIAHALWGGLLLIVAALLPLAFANRWALRAGALAGGIGTGLFIDEVGKFITQANDYFFAPALSIIYGFVLLNVFVYLRFRRPHQENPRKAMYHALEGLKDALDGDLDTAEAARIEAQLAIAKRSGREEVVSLANAIGDYLRKEKQHLATAAPGHWKRVAARVDSLGRRLGHRVLRSIISALLILWVAFVIGYIAVLMLSGTGLDSQVVRWRSVLIPIQAAIGSLMLVGLIYWLARNEERGLGFAILGLLLSLVALQSLYFYISQFAAITSTLIQLGVLQVLLAYGRWYLGDRTLMDAIGRR